MKGTVSYDGETSQPFPMQSGVKQGCVLAPNLFGIFFSLLLNFAFGQSTKGIHLHTRSDGKLFNLARLRAKTKVRPVLIREMLFADDAALSSHTKEALQQLMDRFSHACKEFGLTISIKKTNVMGQDVPSPPAVTIDNVVLDVTNHFTYLGSTITSNLSLHAEINKRIAKAAAVMAQLSKRVWGNNQLTLNTKSTRHAFLAACCMAVNLGQHTPDKRTDWRASTFAVCNEFSTSSGRTGSPTPPCWKKLVLSVCISCSASVACDGWGMYTGWITVAYLRTSCTGSWFPVADQQDVQPCGLRMSASVI